MGVGRAGRAGGRGWAGGLAGVVQWCWGRCWGVLGSMHVHVVLVGVMGAHVTRAWCRWLDRGQMEGQRARGQQ